MPFARRPADGAHSSGNLNPERPLATTTDFIEYLCDQAGLAGRLTTRRMFGEYAVYVDGKVVAFACDNRLYVKYVEATAAATALLPSGQAYPGSKPYAVADELLDDGPALGGLLAATADALPLLLPRTKSRSKRARQDAGGKAVTPRR